MGRSRQPVRDHEASSCSSPEHNHAQPAEPEYSVVLHGGYGYGNLGDDLLMVSLYNLLLHGDGGRTIGITVPCDVDYIPRLVPEARVIRRDIPVHVGATSYIYGGGTQWYSFPGLCDQSPNATPAECTPPAEQGRLLAACRVARRFAGRARRRLRGGMHTPRHDEVPQFGVAYGQALAVGVGIGPFLVGGEDEVRDTLRGCEWVAVRDAASLQYCRQWGLDQAYLGADVCFIHELWTSANVSHLNAMRGARDVLVVVRDWQHSREGWAYMESLPYAVRLLRRDGVRVTYCAFSKLREGDYVRRLVESGEDVLVWNPDGPESPESFALRLSQFSLVVSARYHGVVIASVLGVPSVAVEVEPKLALVSEALADGCQLWPQPFDPVLLKRLVTAGLREADRRRDVLGRAVADQRRMGLKMIDRLKERL